jgi:hypothetical protein
MKSRVALAALLIASGIYPQSPDPRPEFDAASIKLNVNCGERRGRGGGTLSDGYWATSCVPLRTLIRLAYAPPQHSFFRQTDVLGRAAWLDTEVYDVVATGSNIGSIARWHAMLQRLLEDRCNLKIHTEMREVPVYALTVAKGGLKIHPPKPGSGRIFMRSILIRTLDTRQVLDWHGFQRTGTLATTCRALRCISWGSALAPRDPQRQNPAVC